MSNLSSTQPKSAESYLCDAIDIIGDRGKQYEQQKERSMPKIVAVFNLITGLTLTESQGWLFMQILKLVRLHSGNGFHNDSALDAIAYAALAAESGSNETC